MAQLIAASLTCCRLLRTSSAGAPSWLGTSEEPLCAFFRAACRSTSLLLSLSRKSLVFWMEAPCDEMQCLKLRRYRREVEVRGVIIESEGWSNHCNKYPASWHFYFVHFWLCVMFDAL